MSQEHLPLIGSSGRKPAAKKPPRSSPALQHPLLATRRKRMQKQHEQQQSSSSSSYPHQAPPSSTFHPDASMTPWGGHSLFESSFTSIPPPPPPPPQPTPASPHRRERTVARGVVAGSNPCSPNPSPSVPAPQESAGRGGARGVRVKKRVAPQCRVPRAPRLPPLRPVTNLSFSPSFTFSFFELPLHQTPRCRVERIRDLMLMLRQIQY